MWCSPIYCSSPMCATTSSPPEHSGLARLGRRNPIPLHSRTRQDVQAYSVCQVRRERVLDGGHYRKRHSGPVARRARIRGRGYLRRRRDLDFADIARLQTAYRRSILRGLQCQGLAASKGRIDSSFTALTVRNLGMCMSEEKKEHANTGLNPLHCAKITGSLPMS